MTDFFCETVACRRNLCIEKIGFVWYNVLINFGKRTSGRNAENRGKENAIIIADLIMILYHGSPNEIIVPQYGFGDGKHDYGRGFYLTEDAELAKEWAVCRPDETNGWVHKYELDTADLRILDFKQYNVLCWLAELMKHRDAADSRRYRVLAEKFIAKYGIDASEYDVIKGWRADASYFYIAKEFVRDNIDIEILEELLSLGGLGIQYCIKSERAYSKLTETADSPVCVDYSEFNDRYNRRDIAARKNMRELVDSEANKVTNVFSTLF